MGTNMVRRFAPKPSSTPERTCVLRVESGQGSGGREGGGGEGRGERMGKRHIVCKLAMTEG